MIQFCWCFFPCSCCSSPVRGSSSPCTDFSTGPTQLDELAAEFDSRLGAPVLCSGHSRSRAHVPGRCPRSGIGARVDRQVIARPSRCRPPVAPPDRSVSIPVCPVNRQIVSRMLAAALLFSFCLPPIWRGLAGLFEKPVVRARHRERVLCQNSRRRRTWLLHAARLAQLSGTCPDHRGGLWRGGLGGARRAWKRR